MTTILDILGTSTPVSESLAERLGYVRAAIACRIFFYQNLSNGLCNASIATLAKKLGMSTGAVSSNLTWLRENGYVVSVGEHKSGNEVNKYRVGAKFYQDLNSEHSSNEIEHSADESNIQQMNGKEESKEDVRIKERSQPRPQVIPALKVFVHVTGKHCLSQPQIAEVSRQVGKEEAALKKWEQVVKTWVLRGHKPTNAAGMLEWFANGIPAYANGHQSPPEPPKPKMTYVPYARSQTDDNT